MFCEGARVQRLHSVSLVRDALRREGTALEIIGEIRDGNTEPFQAKKNDEKNDHKNSQS